VSLAARDETSIAAAHKEGSSKWAVLGIVAIGVFMVTLDASIVNISLLMRGQAR
jgi:hypothetical protein